MAQVSYSQVMLEMRRTVFCFLLPGDTASSRRLSDIMMAGCIPVFLGAPWHAMPFADELRYKDFALFFQLHAFQRNSSMCVVHAGPAHAVMCLPLGLGTLSPNRVVAWARLRAPRARQLHAPLVSWGCGVSCVLIAFAAMCPMRAKPPCCDVSM